jgi:hypothetical protein
MLEQIRTVDGETLLPLPAERFIESEFNQIFQDVMQTRRNAYRKLA